MWHWWHSVLPKAAPLPTTLNESDAASYVNCAYPHPFVSGKRFESFSMNDTDFSVSGTSTLYGDAVFFFFVHSVLTMMEPSGNGLPFSGTPCLYALIIVGFATMLLMPSSVWLGATICHVS